jgi:hypothetical protein
VLFFYPLDFTFACPTEIAAFNDVADQLAAMSAIRPSALHVAPLLTLPARSNCGGLQRGQRVRALGVDQHAAKAGRHGQAQVSAAG